MSMYRAYAKAAPSEAATPTPSRAPPLQTSTTSERPVSASDRATQRRRRTGSWTKKRDQNGCDVLDHQCDSDVQVRDRGEVQEVDEGKAGDPEDQEEPQLPSGQPEALGAQEGDGGEQDQPRPGGAKLGEPKRRKTARVDDDLGHRGVHRPETDGGDDQRVPERRPPARGPISENLTGERRVGHGPLTLASGTIRVLRDVAQPGSAPALGAGGRRFESGRPD